MLQNVLKSKFGYDNFKNDIQKQAITAIHKGFYGKLISFTNKLLILSVICNMYFLLLKKYMIFFFNKYVYQICKK